MNDPNIGPTVVDEIELQQRICELGKDLTSDYAANPPLLVGILKGAFMFMADLVRGIPRQMTCDFLGVRSYGDATVSSGVVEITSDLASPIDGRHVLLIEDIADTGLTLGYLQELLLARRPASLHTCVLLAKPTTSPSVKIDFVGFEALRAIRRREHQSRDHTPVIALTAHAMAGDKEKALKAGCDDYDTKPVELPRLLAKIDALLAKKTASTA